MVQVTARLDVACQWTWLSDGVKRSTVSKAVCRDIDLSRASRYAGKKFFQFHKHSD